MNTLKDELAFCIDSLIIDWDESKKTFSPSVFFLLSQKNLVEWRAFCGLPEAIDIVLIEVSNEILTSKDLSLLAWHTYSLMYIKPETNENFNGWPDLRNALKGNAGVFYLIIALAMVPIVKLNHQRRSIPIEITKDTCRQVFHFSENYRRDFPNEWGVLRSQLYWLRHYAQGRIFRLGRFEYKLEHKNVNVCVLKNKNSNQIKTLARNGLMLDKDGYVRRAECIAEGNFTASLLENKNIVYGHLVSPLTGSVSRETTKYCLDKWEKIFWTGDLFLDMHIPGGGGMALDLCVDSFQKAFAFFDKFFSFKLAKLIVCQSWVFSPLLSEILPLNSNLIQLQRIVRLYPVSKNDRDGFFFIFGIKGETAEFSQLPRNTSLQNSILNYVSSGKKWFGGGMIFLRNDNFNIKKNV
jgi:hypothetical protein